MFSVYISLCIKKFDFKVWGKDKNKSLLFGLKREISVD